MCHLLFLCETEIFIFLGGILKLIWLIKVFYVASRSFWYIIMIMLNRKSVVPENDYQQAVKLIGRTRV